MEFDLNLLRVLVSLDEARNVTRAAQQLGMSARTIDNLVRRNELPPGVRMGRQCYWSRTVVDRFTERAFAAQENWTPLKSRRG